MPHVLVFAGTKMRAVTGKLPCAELLLRVHLTPRPPPLLGAIALDALPVYEPTHAELASKYYDDTPVALDASLAAAAEPALRPKVRNDEDEPVHEAHGPGSLSANADGNGNENAAGNQQNPAQEQRPSPAERPASPDSLIKYTFFSPGDANDLYLIERFVEPSSAPQQQARPSARLHTQQHTPPPAAAAQPTHSSSAEKEKPRSQARRSQQKPADVEEDDPDTPRPDPYRRPEWPPRESFNGVCIVNMHILC